MSEPLVNNHSTNAVGKISALEALSEISRPPANDEPVPGDRIAGSLLARPCLKVYAPNDIQNTELLCRKIKKCHSFKDLKGLYETNKAQLNAPSLLSILKRLPNITSPADIQTIINQLLNHLIDLLSSQEKESPLTLAKSLQYVPKCTDPERKHTLLRLLYEQIANHPSEFKPSELSMILDYLSNIKESSNSKAYHLLGLIIQALEPKFKASTEIFNSKDLVECFYRLYGQDTQSCKGIIKQLETKLKQCPEKFNPQDLAMCFYGLHGQDTQSCEGVMKQLETKLEQCTEKFNPKNLAMCFYGLYDQNPESCKGVIQKLKTKLDQSTEKFNLSSLAMCFYGLHGQDPQNCGDVIQKLIEKLDSSNSSKEPQYLTMILNALKFHLVKLDLGKLCSFLENHIKGLDFNAISYAHDALTKELALLTYSYQGNGGDQYLTRLTQLQKTLLDQRPLLPNKYNTTREEQLIADLIIDKFPDWKLDMHTVRDGIEMDILVTKESRCINIESDGSSHNRKGEDQIRDDYLKGVHKIRTIRIPVNTVRQRIQEILFRSLVKAS